LIEASFDLESNPEDENKRILCFYKGKERRIRPEVCFWHRWTEKDPECIGCKAWKYPIEEIREG